MIHYRNCLKRAIERATHDPRFPHQNIYAFALELPMSPDAFNNRLYGYRTDDHDRANDGSRFDQDFLLAVIGKIRQHCPDIARDFLRELFRDPTITLIDDALLPAKDLGFCDLAHLALQIGSMSGALQGLTVEQIADGALTSKEAKASLDQIRALVSKANEISAAIMNAQNGNGNNGSQAVNSNQSPKS